MTMKGYSDAAVEYTERMTVETIEKITTKIPSDRPSCLAASCESQCPIRDRS